LLVRAPAKWGGEKTGICSPQIFKKNIVEEKKEMCQILIIEIGSIRETYYSTLNTVGSASGKHVTVPQYYFEVDGAEVGLENDCADENQQEL
jgi:hypothetical protein